MRVEIVIQYIVSSLRVIGQSSTVVRFLPRKLQSGVLLTVVKVDNLRAFQSMIVKDTLQLPRRYCCRWRWRLSQRS